MKVRIANMFLFFILSFLLGIIYGTWQCEKYYAPLLKEVDKLTKSVLEKRK